MTSAGLNNLVAGSANHKLTDEERQRGLENSIKTRKEKARMRKLLEECLKMKNDKGLTYEQLATLGLIKGAIDGNAKNYETIVTMLGERPDMQVNSDIMPQVQIEIVDNSELNKYLKDE